MWLSTSEKGISRELQINSIRLATAKPIAIAYSFAGFPSGFRVVLFAIVVSVVT
jgi:hypothetical protein